MKNLLSIFALISSLAAFGQTINDSTAHKISIENLVGNWFLKDRYSNTDSALTFTRQLLGMGGQEIKILNDGTFVDECIALCGNDTRAYHNNGEWKVNKTSLIFETTIPLAKLGNRFQIIELTQYRLVLKQVG